MAKQKHFNQSKGINHYRIYILILAVMFYASGAESKEGIRITNIIIEGNNKTKDSVILTIIKVKVGDLYTEGLEKDIEQRLLNSRMFYDIGVEIDERDKGMIMKIKLKDKWSLIPFPIVSLREDEERYGIALMESNLFGYHKRLLVTLFGEDNRFSQGLSYYDKNFMNSNYRLLFIVRNISTPRYEWNDKQRINDYYATSVGTDIGVGYGFNNNISISLIHRLHYFSHDSRINTLRRPDDRRESMLGLLIDIDRADYNEDFTEGFIGRILLERDLEFSGSEFDRTIVSWRLNWFLNPILRHNLIFINSGAFGNNLPYGYRFRIGQQRNEYLHELRGYERDRFETNRALITTVEYRIPLYSFREANISFVSFADNAIFENEYQRFNLKESKSDAGLSIRIYLRRLIVPVFQIYSAYGFSNERFLTGISIGMTF